MVSSEIMFTGRTEGFANLAYAHAFAALDSYDVAPTQPIDVAIAGGAPHRTWCHYTGALSPQQMSAAELPLLQVTFFSDEELHKY